MELEFREAFLKDVKSIGNAALKKKIAAVISDAEKAVSLFDLKNVKKMEGSVSYYRIRVGDYRIGVKLQEKTLVFLLCLDRKDIYRYFP
jgi:mRNA interferase RelE/StbE